MTHPAPVCPHPNLTVYPTRAHAMAALTKPSGTGARYPFSCPAGHWRLSLTSEPER